MGSCGIVGWPACPLIALNACIHLARSRVLVGALSAEELTARPDVNGTSFQEASTAAGYGGPSHQVPVCMPDGQHGHHHDPARAPTLHCVSPTGTSPGRLYNSVIPRTLRIWPDKLGGQQNFV